MPDGYTLFRRRGPLGDRIVMSRQVRRDANLTMHLSVTLSYEPNEAGLPDPSVLPDLQKSEAKIERALVAACRAVFVGHTIGGGRFTCHFYAPRPGPSTISVKVSLLRSIELPVRSILDPDWARYDADLAPTGVEKLQTTNDRLLSALAAQGDVAWAPRTIDFTSFLPSSEAAAAFSADVTDAGYQVDPPTPTDDGMWLVEAHREMPALEDVVHQFCETFVTLAERHGGEFDGWACALVRR